MFRGSQCLEEKRLPANYFETGSNFQSNLRKKRLSSPAQYRNRSMLQKPTPKSANIGDFHIQNENPKHHPSSRPKQVPTSEANVAGDRRYRNPRFNPGPNISRILEGSNFGRAAKSGNLLANLGKGVNNQSFEFRNYQDRTSYLEGVHVQQWDNPRELIDNHDGFLKNWQANLRNIRSAVIPDQSNNLHILQQRLRAQRIFNFRICVFCMAVLTLLILGYHSKTGFYSFKKVVLQREMSAQNLKYEDLKHMKLEEYEGLLNAGRKMQNFKPPSLLAFVWFYLKLLVTLVAFCGSYYQSIVMSNVFQYDRSEIYCNLFPFGSNFRPSLLLSGVSFAALSYVISSSNFGDYSESQSMLFKWAAICVTLHVLIFKIYDSNQKKIESLLSSSRYMSASGRWLTVVIRNFAVLTGSYIGLVVMFGVCALVSQIFHLSLLSEGFKMTEIFDLKFVFELVARLGAILFAHDMVIFAIRYSVRVKPSSFLYSPKNYDFVFKLLWLLSKKRFPSFGKNYKFFILAFSVENFE